MYAAMRCIEEGDEQGDKTLADDNKKEIILKVLLVPKAQPKDLQTIFGPQKILVRDYV